MRRCWSGGDTFFVLDFLLDSFDSVGRFDVQSNSLSGQCLDKDLHPRTTAKAQYEMQGRFLLDVIISESTTIFQLFASENETLLVRGDAFFVLDFFV